MLAQQSVISDVYLSIHLLRPNIVLVQSKKKKKKSEGTPSENVMIESSNQHDARLFLCRTQTPVTVRRLAEINRSAAVLINCPI